MLHLITQEDIEKAINYLAIELPIVTLERAYESLHKNNKTNLVFDFSLGIRTRKVLRKGGFNWNDAVYDDIWKRLIKEAAQKVIGNQKWHG